MGVDKQVTVPGRAYPSALLPKTAISSALPSCASFLRATGIVDQGMTKFKISAF
jgi:hypothetical protein